jgi:hypothetical protein
MAASIQPLVEAQPNLGLPFAPEIRNEIYKHALSDPAQQEGGGPDTSPLQLLLVSRQTNIEAYAMYYRNNKLHLPNLTLLARFLWNIGDARRAHITNLSFTYNLHDATPRGMGQLLKACSSWRHITVDVRTCCSREPDRYLARVLSQVRGMESVQFGFRRATGWRWGTDCRRRPGIQQPHRNELSWEDLKQLMMRPRDERYSARRTRLVKPYQPMRRSARLQKLRETEGV